jgi:hypothetical protein
VESAVAVGLAEQTAADKAKMIPTSASGVGTDELSVSTPLGNAIATPTTPQRARAVTPVINQTWEFSGGEVTLQISTSQALPANAFSSIGPIVAAISGLVRLLDEPDSGVPAGGERVPD